MKTRTNSWLLSLLVVPVLGLALNLVSTANAADNKADGTWTWTMPARNGGTERKMTLKLKTEGEKLTGKMISPARDGQTRETEIQEGKVKGEEISFTVTREVNNTKMTSKYTGKVTADAIKGKVETTRDGNAQSRDWEAKRDTAAAK